MRSTIGSQPQGVQQAGGVIGERTASTAAGDAATWQLLLGPNGETLQQQHHDQLRWLEEVRGEGLEWVMVG